PDAQSADLMSYLLFDAAYTRALIDIGYRDASERIDEIEAFLHAAAEATETGDSVHVVDDRALASGVPAEVGLTRGARAGPPAPAAAPTTSRPHVACR